MAPSKIAARYGRVMHFDDENQGNQPRSATRQQQLADPSEIFGETEIGDADTRGDGERGYLEPTHRLPRRFTN